VPVIKALSYSDQLISQAATFPGIDLLIDAPQTKTTTKARGGHGQTWDWAAIHPLLAQGRRVWIAGGITPQNVGSVCEQLMPFGVDVASGVELSPPSLSNRKAGQKDPKKIRQFVDRIQSSQSFSASEQNRTGYFGGFGGRFVPETLVPALDELTRGYNNAKRDPSYWADLNGLLSTYVGRPTPLYYAEKISQEIGATVYFKREDLAHTGAHKINNALGQVLLAKRLGKTRIIAETGAGQHGVATATACARLGMTCEVYMGEEDVKRQSLNVFRMKLLGAQVHPVTSGSRTLKDALNEAMRDWVTHVRNTFYVIGSTAGPHPYPMLVRDLQSVIGREAREQFASREPLRPTVKKDTSGNLIPDVLMACIGGGSNAMGLFYPFLSTKSMVDKNLQKIRIIGVEAGGQGMDSGKHGATISQGSHGILHGSESFVLQNDHGQINEAHSISAGLDYPGVGPEHAWLHQSKRASYIAINDRDALDAFDHCSKIEGIIPAFETAHAIAALYKLKIELKNKTVILNFSGRGDKDVIQAQTLLSK